MSPSPPIILLIPGSFHPPELWSTIQDPLQLKGYKTSTTPLLSNGVLPQLHNDIRQREISAIHAHVLSLLDSGSDVLVVMHSYAGISGTDAMAGLSVQERKAGGKSNGVIGLVYMCAFMLAEGEGLFDLPKDPNVKRVLEWDTDEDGWQVVTTAVEAFYHDVPREYAETLKRKLVKRDGSFIHGKVTYPAYKYIPTTYVHTEQDRALPIGLQKHMVQKARDSGITIDVVRWQTGHSPFFVNAAMVVEFLTAEAEKRRSQ